jgi:hypothetical protein
MCLFLSLVIAPFLALLASPVRSGIISLPSLSHGSPVIPPGRLAVLGLAEAQVPSCIDLSAEKSQLAINPVTSQPATASGHFRGLELPAIANGGGDAVTAGWFVARSQHFAALTLPKGGSHDLLTAAVRSGAVAPGTELPPLGRLDD